MTPIVIDLAVAWHAWSRDESFPFAKLRTSGYCINATRTGIDALALLGVKARPVSVSLLVANRAATELIAAGVSPDGGAWPPWAWSIGLGYDNATAEGRWNGHLVIEVDGCTVDLGAEVLHRPGLITIDGPLILPPLPAEGEVLLETCGVTVLMERRPEHNAWRTASAWTTPRPELASELARRIRKELA